LLFPCFFIFIFHLISCFPFIFLSIPFRLSFFSSITSSFSCLFHPSLYSVPFYHHHHSIPSSFFVIFLLLFHSIPFFIQCFFSFHSVPFFFLPIPFHLLFQFCSIPSLSFNIYFHPIPFFFHSFPFHFFIPFHLPFHSISKFSQLSSINQNCQFSRRDL